MKMNLNFGCQVCVNKLSATAMTEIKKLMTMRGQQSSLYAMSAFYFLAGLNHLVHPDFYLGMMPSWLSWHYELILISGIAEMLLAIGLLYQRSRVISAWCVILMLIVIFPANIQMATNFYREKHPFFWLVILRLPLQLLFIYWAFTLTSRPDGKKK
jgi:uncharacterized membrane protein